MRDILGATCRGAAARHAQLQSAHAAAASADPIAAELFRHSRAEPVVAWVAAGKHAAYVTDGGLRDPRHAGRGLLVAADPATHEALVALVEPHLRAALTGV